MGHQQCRPRREFSNHAPRKRGRCSVNPPTPVVFVVDDESSVRSAVARLMRSAGLAVTTFASPQAFLDAYRADVPGCLILDVSMPSISGLELQEALARRDGVPPPIVFLT